MDYWRRFCGRWRIFGLKEGEALKSFITSIEYVLPQKKVDNPKDRLTRKTGILSRHICEENETAADLAVRAAEKLFAKGVDKKAIDYLLLCTQSPDYYLPTTACVLQDRLKLSNNCGAFDYNLGCSGYIYGLSIVKGLIESGQAKNVLLLTAETYSKYINPKDNTVYPLFGDAATATLIQGFDEKKSGLDGFVLGTNGTGYKNLIVPVGGMRARFEDTTLAEVTDEYGNYRTNRNLYMHGSAISDFALEVVLETVDRILAKCKMEKQDVGYYVFHQANKFMLQFLQMKCGLLEYPFWNDVKEYGNTVSSSIPIALVDMMQENRDKDISKVMSVGFGVGLSWGGCVIDMSKYTVE